MTQYELVEVEELEEDLCYQCDFFEDNGHELLECPKARKRETWECELYGPGKVFKRIPEGL